jgi:hypothetical protein
VGNGSVLGMPIPPIIHGGYRRDDFSKVVAERCRELLSSRLTRLRPCSFFDGFSKQSQLLGELMASQNKKLAATACLFAMLALPAAVLADGPDSDKDKYDRHKPKATPEPSTLVLTLVGVGIGTGLILAGLRRNRRSAAA